MSGKSGTDARFPYEHRQIVVVRLLLFLLWAQVSVQVSVGCGHQRTGAMVAQDILRSVRVKCGHLVLP